METTEDGNWTNVKRIHQNGPTIESSTFDSDDKDAIVSYSTSK